MSRSQPSNSAQLAQRSSILLLRPTTGGSRRHYLVAGVIAAIFGLLSLGLIGSLPLAQAAPTSLQQITNPNQFYQNGELIGEPGEPDSRMGASVAISGNTVVVGAPTVGKGGAVYVYEMSTDPNQPVFEQVAELTPTTPANNELGTSVAISGNTIVAGAPGTYGGERRSGLVFVFEKAGGVWGVDSHESSVLNSPAPQADEEFGFSVGVAGDTIIVGAPGRNEGQDRQGALFVFDKPGTGWATSGVIFSTATLTVTNPAAGDRLGSSLAQTEDTVIAGAPFRDPGIGIGQGAAFIYEKESGKWGNAGHETAALTTNKGDHGNRFGFAVALSDDAAVVGSPHRVGTLGSAFVFLKPHGGWRTVGDEDSLLTAKDGETGDHLGASVSIFGDTVAVGVPGRRIDGARPGATLVFQKPTTGWTPYVHENASLVANNIADGDELGTSAAISNDFIIAGAPGKNAGSGAGQGATYVFGADVTPPTISIGLPGDGARFEQHQAEIVNYSCNDSESGVQPGGCEGVLDGVPVQSGEPLDTSTIGTHHLTVNAIDRAGNRANPVTHTFVVEHPRPVHPPKPTPHSDSHPSKSHPPALDWKRLVVPKSAMGSARFSATSSRSLNKWLSTSILGHQITKVSLSIDGKHVKLIKAHPKAGSAQRIRVKLNTSKLRRGAHKVTAKVTFASSARTKQKVLNLRIMKS